MEFIFVEDVALHVSNFQTIFNVSPKEIDPEHHYASFSDNDSDLTFQSVCFISNSCIKKDLKQGNDGLLNLLLIDVSKFSKQREEIQSIVLQQGLILINSTPSTILYRTYDNVFYLVGDVDGLPPGQVVEMLVGLEKEKEEQKNDSEKDSEKGTILPPRPTRRGAHKKIDYFSTLPNDGDLSLQMAIKRRFSSKSLIPPPSIPLLSCSLLRLTSPHNTNTTSPIVPNSRVPIPFSTS